MKGASSIWMMGRKKSWNSKRMKFVFKVFELIWMEKWLEGYPIGTKMTATDFVILILVIPYNVLTARAYRMSFIYWGFNRQSGDRIYQWSLWYQIKIRKLQAKAHQLEKVLCPECWKKFKEIFDWPEYLLGVCTLRAQTALTNPLKTICFLLFCLFLSLWEFVFRVVNNIF